MLDAGSDLLEVWREELREREELAAISARFEPRREGVELLAAARAAAELDVAELSDEGLVSLAGEVERAQRFVDAARCVLHGALDARGATVEGSGHTTRTWLGAEHGLSLPELGRRVRVASKLHRHLPVVADALVAGEITFEHARVIADLLNPRVHDLVIGLQAQLLARARGVRFERWVAEVRDLIAGADADGGHDPSPERNRLSMADGLDGELFLKGTLVGEHAAVLRHTLGEMADRLFHRRRRDADAAPEDLPMPTRPRLLAEALVELCRAGTVASHTGKGPAVDVTVVIDASEPTGAHTPDGVRLADRTTRLFRCDPTLTALVRDSLGVPLDLGTSVRFATPDQRRAAAVRDGGCVFPGCDVPASWVDLHHVHHAEDGGPTDLENLAGLCRHHHGVVHRKGWSMKATQDQWFMITTPTRARLHSQRHGRQRHGRQGHGPPRAGP